ncbi:MAG: serine hydrolase domain-containing protein [Thermoanaerobaculia bacterium]|nr:serine hydrolase domain-containing protein [Thermoanaerobaculia bacterium]
MSTARSLRTLATILLASALLIAPGLYASDSDSRDLAMAAPADVGMSAEGLDKISEAMQTIIDDGELVGASVVVARHGKIVYFETFGEQNQEEGIPMSKDTIFRIYSMTKPIVGVALMQLYDQGKFKLSDPVEKYIPEMAGVKVAKADGPDGKPEVEAPGHKMTIRELVSHTGGLTYGLFARSQVDTLYQQANILDRDSTLAQFAEKLGKIPLKHQPGTAWEYSVSVDLQGYLVEVLSGQPLDEYLDEHVFEPLGMKDTGFWVDAKDAGRLSPLYGPNREGKLAPRPSDEYLTKPAFFSGGGGLVSTAMDYTRFAQMLLNRGELDGKRILKPETVDLMFTSMIPESMEYINPMISTPGNKFGIDLSLVVNPDGKTDHTRAKGEGWWYGIGGTWFGANPEQDLLVVGMIQNFGGQGARKARFQSKFLAYEAISE